MTLCFMMTAGLVAMVTLWTIGYASAAYNSLYETTQSAAYASVGQAISPGQDGGDQLTFKCGNVVISDQQSRCTEGDTLTAAQEVFRLAYSTSEAGKNFGLSFNANNTANIKLINELGQPDPMVRAYIITSPTTVAYGKANAAFGPGDFSATCASPNGGIIGSGTTMQRVCWGVAETYTQNNGGSNRTLANLFFPPQYVSGVIVRASATVKTPGCGWLCPTFNITTVGAASVGQPAPRAAY